MRKVRHSVYRPGVTTPMGDMNTTPLIDVMLVLLVMVIITAPLPNHKIGIDLPRGGALFPIEQKNDIHLTADGRVQWNGTDATLADIARQVRVASDMPTVPELRITGDKTARYERFAQLVSTVRRAGAPSVSFPGIADYRDAF